MSKNNEILENFFPLFFSVTYGRIYGQKFYDTGPWSIISLSLSHYLIILPSYRLVSWSTTKPDIQTMMRPLILGLALAKYRHLNSLLQPFRQHQLKIPVRRGFDFIQLNDPSRAIQEADKILVLKDGQIIEQGNHESLLSDKGFYYDLYMSQFSQEEAV